MIKSTITPTLVGVFSLLCLPAAFSKESIKDLTTANKDKDQEVVVQEKAPTPPAVAPIQDNIQMHSLGIGIGETYLLSDFRHHGDDSISADLLYSYSASHSFDMMIDAHYSSHEYKKQNIELWGLAIGIKAKLFQFDSFAPFITGGLGFYIPKERREIDGRYVDSESKITLGDHIGTGIELRLNPHYLVGFLFHYHNPFDVKQENQPTIQGSYLKLLLTGQYTF